MPTPLLRYQLNLARLGMANRRREKPSNNQLPDGLAQYALSIIRGALYRLWSRRWRVRISAELHDVHLSKEIVRSLMGQSRSLALANNVRRKFSSHVIAGLAAAN